MRNKILLILFLFISSCNSEMNAQFRPAKIFGEHMVLQRAVEQKIWGWSSAKDIVILEFKGVTQQVNADENGYWEFGIPAQKAGGPFELKVYNVRKKYEWKDVYFGDVWLCSGQSNMEWPLKFTDAAATDIPLAEDAEIREFKVPRSSAVAPAQDLEGGSWINGSLETVGDFTAVGYYFAKHIKNSQGVPIGLLNSSWGGSRIEPWMSAASLGIDDVSKMMEERAAEKKKERAILTDKLIKNFKGFSQPETHLPEKTVEWELTGLNDDHWVPMKINGNWENEGYEKMDGVLWYRNTIELTRAQSKRAYQLQLGTIDDSDRTFVNGQLVGKMDQSYNVERSYTVPAELLKPGKNVIAVRVEDTGGGGGINAIKGTLGLKSEKEFIDVFDNWKVMLEAQYLTSAFDQNQVPTMLFHQMIYPLAQFPIKGVLWYQGESNAGQEEEKYAQLFKDMIQLWRAHWQQPELPFLFVQLAAFTDPPLEPEYSSWPQIRNAQYAALELKNTGMASAIDLGEKDDIHPQNKKDVGKRLGLIAEHLVYGLPVKYRGPEPDEIRLEDGKIIIKYKHDEGLYFKNDNLSERQFSVAGANGKYYWATPKLVDNQVVLECPAVADPWEVRYAWATNPDQASLYNAANLPAVPFTKKIMK